MINLRNLAGTALALAALLAACGGQNVPIDAELSVTDHTVVYNGLPQTPEITFDPPGAEIGAEVLITPEGGTPLESGTWPIDAGVYAVVVRASVDHGGREVEGTLTIEPRPVTVLPATGQSKAVDEADPELVFVASGLVLDHELSGALARESGEAVGTYAFTLGSLDGGPNYAVALATDAPSFVIVSAVLGDGAISVSGTSVVYDGEPQSAVVSFDPPAAAAGAIVTYTGVAVGELPVDAGSYPFSVVAGPGYDGSVSGTFVIEARPVSVMPTVGQSKAFAEADPELTYVASGLVGDDELSGDLARVAGETVGSYAFLLGSLAGGSNYDVSLSLDAPSFVIVDAVLGDGAISVSGTSVVYDGESQDVVVVFNPPAASVGAVVDYEGFEAGVLPVDAGSYPFTVTAGTGYDGSVTGELVIAPRPVSVLPTAGQSKAFSDADPELTYVASGFVGDDALSGDLGREPGETVGSYAFTLGSLTGSSNYAVSLAVDAPSFAIVDVVLGDGAISVTGTSAVYDGEPQGVLVTFDPPAASEGAVVAYTGVANGDLPVDAGSYPFTVTAGPGYDGSVSGTLVIAPMGLSVTEVFWSPKVYDGGTGATASATLATESVVSGDDVSLAANLVGQFASANVGTHDVVGAFQLVGPAAANYVVAPQPTGTAAITARPVALLNAELAAKTFDGTAMADVSGTLQGTAVNIGVLTADVARLGFEASFAQVAATEESVDVAVVLTGPAAPNYFLDPVPTFSAPIAPAVAVVLPDEGQSKTYGDDDAVLEFTVSGLFGDDAVTGALGRIAGEDVGAYAFDLGTLDAGDDYVLELATDLPTFAITPRAITLSTTDDETLYGTTPKLAAVLVDGSTLRFGDTLFGALARPDDAVGTYTYTLGDATIERDDGEDMVDVSANYTIGFGTYEVTARPLTITAGDRTKTYGDPLELGTIEFAVAPSDDDSGLVDEEHVHDVVLTSDGAAASATVAGGPYPILASDATGMNGFDAANYDITYVPGSLTVEPRVVTVTGTFSVADKAYDGSAEAGTVDLSGLVLNNLAEGDDVGFDAVASFPDALVGDGKVATLTTVTLTGSDAGNYSVSLVDAPTTTGSMVKADIEFGITIAGTNFATEVVYDGDRTFQPNVTTNPVPVPSNVLVSYDVEITYDPTGGSVGSFNAVGTYTVTVTSTDPRYVGSSTQAVQVLARPITIASSAIHKTYGTLDPAMVPTLTDGTSFGRNESFFLEGWLTYVRGDQQTPYEDVGTYPFHLGSVAVHRNVHQDVTSNYSITFADEFEVVPAIVTVTPSADQGKTYGDADLVLGYATNGLRNEDALTGALDREAGEDVGTYAFTLGDLDGGANYTLELADPAPTYAIVARPLTLTTADPVYTYGDTDLDLAAVLAEGSTLREGDALAGSLELTGTHAGTHAFGLGTATLTSDGADVASNYAVAFADYTMAPRPAIVTPDVDQSKTYGDSDPVFGYSVVLLDDDVLTGALARDEGEDVGTYAFTLGDLANPNYALTLVDEAATFAITARPILLEVTDARKDFSTSDPDLSPVLGGDSSLRDGDDLVGALAHGGVNVGSYPLLLDSVQVMREDANVTGNYAITFGTFTIDPLPVAFDISNADLVTGGEDRTHVFFGDGTEPIRGLTVAVTPDGATPNFRFTYVWTHDADHVPFGSPIAVQRIQDLGTYQVTVTATSPNHVGATTLTVWVTDVAGVDFAEPAYEALVGATVFTQVQLVGPDGTPRFAGPVPIVVDLVRDGYDVGFVTEGDPVWSTTVQIAPGATGADVGVIATALGNPSLLIATMTDGGNDLAVGTATFTPTVQFAFEPTTVARGAGAVTEPVTVRLTGYEGIAVTTPVDFWVDLQGSPEGLVFRDAEDTQNTTVLIIPAGSSEAGFRMLADAAGTYTATSIHMSHFAGIANGELTFTVAPRPVVGTIVPGSVGKAQSTSVTVTGTGFAQGASVQFSGNDVVVDSVVVVNPTELFVTLTIDATTDLGARDITVTNADGGTSTTADALTLTAPTLTANDDGPFDIVEGGNRTFSIANDLLANDTTTGTTGFVFDGFIDASGVTYEFADDLLTVSVPADAGGSTASLEYRILDSFGTTATATVDFNVTFAPVEALLFSNPTDANHFMSQSYVLPSFQDIFNSWPRFSGITYFTSPNGTGSTWTGAPSNWIYNSEDDRIEFGANLDYDGIVSPDGFEYFTFEGTLQSTNTDDDSIGLIAAFRTNEGTPVYLTAHRSNGGTGPARGWGLTLTTGTTEHLIAHPNVPGFTTDKNAAGNGWFSSGASRVRVVRTGDILRLSATNWFTRGTTAPAYEPLSEITLDLATGEVTYYDGGWKTEATLANVAQFQGRQQYGYFVRSQANTTYVDIDFVGGVARDRVIVLIDESIGQWYDSIVYRYENESWNYVGGAKIQSELGFPRLVTSVVDEMYADHGRSFQIYAERVVVDLH